MDKRVNNGGHSTQSNKLIDKRKSTTKELLQQYLNTEVDYHKLSALMEKIYEGAMSGDVKCASMYLNYAVGKPVDVVVQKVEEKGKNLPPWLDVPVIEFN
jgi:hypothetical protein